MEEFQPSARKKESPKKGIHPLEIVQVVLLIGFAYLFYLWKGPALAVLMAMMWADKNLVTRLKFQGEFGVEFLVLASALAGIIYGPVFGFIFGFVIITIVGGLIELISWMIEPPYAPGAWPFIPSPENLVHGIVGVIAGLMAPAFPLIVIILVVSIVKNILIAIKDQLIGWPPKFAYLLNIIFNVALVLALGPYIEALIQIG